MKTKCSACGERTSPALVSESFAVGSMRVKVLNIPVANCGSCGEATLSLETAKQRDAVVAHALALNNVIEPDALKYMRKVMGIKATELAELFGLAPKTVSRWETGKGEINRTTLVTLQAMVTEFSEDSSATLDHLRTLRADGSRRRAPKELRLTMIG